MGWPGSEPLLRPAEIGSASSRPILCLVTDRAASVRPLEDAVAGAVEGGIDWVQIRARELAGRELLTHAARIAEVVRKRSVHVRVLINRRVDVALALELDGVHLGFDAMRPADARLLLGRHALVGVSAHAPDEVKAAREGGADYAQLAPVHDPLSKSPGRPALGLGALSVAAADALPVIAQGGIERTNAAAAVAAGATGIAVTGAILMAADPVAAAGALREALDAAQ